jgi:hypothetical protein
VKAQITIIFEGPQNPQFCQISTPKVTPAPSGVSELPFGEIKILKTFCECRE